MTKADKLEQIACQYEQENQELSHLLKDQYSDIKAKVINDFVKSMVRKNQYVKFNNLDVIVNQDELKNASTNAQKKILYSHDNRIDAVGMQKLFSYSMSLVDRGLDQLIKEQTDIARKQLLE